MTDGDHEAPEKQPAVYMLVKVREEDTTDMVVLRTTDGDALGDFIRALQLTPAIIEDGLNDLGYGVDGHRYELVRIP